MRLYLALVILPLFSTFAQKDQLTDTINSRKVLIYCSDSSTLFQKHHIDNNKQLHGSFREYSDKGKKITKKHHYKHGLKSGRFIEYTRYSNRRYESHYRSHRHHRKRNKLKKYAFRVRNDKYKNDSLHGKVITYDEDNGYLISSRSHYKSGKKVGSEMYFDNIYGFKIKNRYSNDKLTSSDTLNIPKGPFNTKTYILHTYGLPSCFDCNEMTYIKDSTITIQLKRVAGCVVNNKILRSAAKNNSKTYRKLISRFGLNWRDQFEMKSSTNGGFWH